MAPMQLHFFVNSHGLTGLTGSGGHLYKEAYFFNECLFLYGILCLKRLKNLLQANWVNGNGTDEPSVRLLPVSLPV